MPTRLQIMLDDPLPLPNVPKQPNPNKKPLANKTIPQPPAKQVRSSRDKEQTQTARTSNLEDRAHFYL